MALLERNPKFNLRSIYSIFTSRNTALGKKNIGHGNERLEVTYIQLQLYIYLISHMFNKVSNFLPF